MGGDECRSVQLIDGDGEFNVPGVENFLKATVLAECGLSYAVVSIPKAATYGILSLSTTFLPDVMSFLKRFAEEVQGQPNVPRITQQNTPMDSQSFRRDSHMRVPSANPVPGASSSSSTYSSPRSRVEYPSTSHGDFEARPW